MAQSEYFDYVTRNLIAGVDEVGRGCVAGPVVAAAVILPKNFRHPKLRDSKKLNEKTRYELVKLIRQEAIAYSVGVVDNEVIDQINILEASMQAMNDAVSNLQVNPEFLLIDGDTYKCYTGHQYQCIIKGDDTYYAIAAASILAKTYRDNYMCHLSEHHPEYGWERNAGYLTKEHKLAIEQYGLTPYHRESFNTSNAWSNNG